MSIRVKEGRAGSRTLVVGAVIDGRDYAEPDAPSSKSDGVAAIGNPLELVSYYIPLTAPIACVGGMLLRYTLPNNEHG